MGSYGEVPIAFHHNKVFQPFSPHPPLKDDSKIPPGMATPTLLQATCSNVWPPLSMKNFFLITNLNLPQWDLRLFPCILSLAIWKKKKKMSNTLLTATFFQVVTESHEVSHQTPLFHTAQTHDRPWPMLRSLPPGPCSILPVQKLMN